MDTDHVRYQSHHSIKFLTWFQVQEKDLIESWQRVESGHIVRMCPSRALGTEVVSFRLFSGYVHNTSFCLVLMLTLKRTGFDSPGSSVFDLPTQQYVAPRLTDNSRVALANVQLQEPQDDDDTSYIVISGGTGGNAICPAFKNASYALPVSDDGGSSSEIIRVLGGPSIGTFRGDLYIHLVELTSVSGR